MRHDFDTRLIHLDDYVRNRSSDEEAREYEEQLFELAVAGGAPELEFRDRLERTFKRLSACGALDLWLTRKDVDRVLLSGRRVALFEVDVQAPAAPEVSLDAELVIARVPLPLADVVTLDMEVLAEHGALLKRMPDVGFDPEDGAIYACCEADLARTVGRQPAVTRIWGTNAAGQRSLLAELRLL